MVMLLCCHVANSSELLGFVRVDDRMMWQVPLTLVSGFVQFNLLDFADITSFDVSVNGFLLTLLQHIIFCRLHSRVLSCPIAQ